MTSYQLEQLLDLLDNGRERLLVALEPLPDQAYLMQNAVNSWTVADLLGNLTAWEAEMVTGMMRLDQGKRPDKLLALLKNPQAFDERTYTENRGRALDQLFSDFQQVRVQLEEWLEMFPERTLNNRRRFKWFKGKSLAEVIAATTFEHEALFLPQLEAFSRGWTDGSLFGGAATAVPPSQTTIPLTETKHDNNNHQ